MLTGATWAPPGGPAVDQAVFFDAPAGEVIDGVFSRDFSVRYRTAAWPNVRESDAITVDGTEYRVRAVEVLDDGLTARAYLTTRRGKG